MTTNIGKPGEFARRRMPATDDSGPYYRQLGYTFRIVEYNKNAECYVDEKGFPHYIGNCEIIPQLPSVYPEDYQTVLKHAQRLASTLHAKHYSNNHYSSMWQPADTISGVIDQIDNMIAGLGKISEGMPSPGRIVELAGHGKLSTRGVADALGAKAIEREETDHIAPHAFVKGRNWPEFCATCGHIENRACHAVFTPANAPAVETDGYKAAAKAAARNPFTPRATGHVCAAEGCLNAATHRFEDGDGSEYCQKHYEQIAKSISDKGNRGA